MLYGHCAKLLGWGVDEETKSGYWLYANTWGMQFGENVSGLLADQIKGLLSRDSSGLQLNIFPKRLLPEIFKLYDYPVYSRSQSIYLVYYIRVHVYPRVFIRATLSSSSNKFVFSLLNKELIRR
jgi:hypothetical protein